MTKSRRRQTESRVFPLEAWPKTKVCFSILLQFPCPGQRAISREELAYAIRSLGFVAEGTRFGISIVMGSVQDVVDAAVARELRERAERAAVSLQRVPLAKRTVDERDDELPEVANG